MKDLKNYAPENPEFVLPEELSFPNVLFVGAKNMDEVRKHLSGKFITESVTSGKTDRKLDAYEKATIRANYAELLEDVQPQLERALSVIEEEMKSQVSEAKERLQAVRTQIRDFVYEVKRGIKEVNLPPDTIKIPVKGFYLFYAWIGNEFRLVRAEKIPAWDKEKLFSNLETNKEAFLDVLGIDIETGEVKPIKEAKDEPTAKKAGAKK